MKTKFLAVLMVTLLSLSFSAWAADYSKAEVFGGYQYTRIDVEGAGINSSGWNAAVSGYFSRYMGVTADFSGAYKSVLVASAKLHTYTFGPVFTVRSNEAFVPFAHVLVGGFRADAAVLDISGGTNGFALMAGGGVDVKVTRHLAVRPAQFDWMMLRAQGVTEKKNIRYSAGLVFRF